MDFSYQQTFLQSALAKDPFALGDLGPEDVLRIESEFPNLFNKTPSPKKIPNKISRLYPPRTNVQPQKLLASNTKSTLSGPGVTCAIKSTQLRHANNVNTSKQLSPKVPTGTHNKSKTNCVPKVRNIPYRAPSQSQQFATSSARVQYVSINELRRVLKEFLEDKKKELDLNLIKEFTKVNLTTPKPPSSTLKKSILQKNASIISNRIGFTSQKDLDQQIFLQPPKDTLALGNLEPEDVLRMQSEFPDLFNAPTSPTKISSETSRLHPRANVQPKKLPIASTKSTISGSGITCTAKSTQPSHAKIVSTLNQVSTKVPTGSHNKSETNCTPKVPNTRLGSPSQHFGTSTQIQHECIDETGLKEFIEDKKEEHNLSIIKEMTEVDLITPNLSVSSTPQKIGFTPADELDIIPTPDTPDLSCSRRVQFAATNTPGNANDGTDCSEMSDFVISTNEKVENIMKSTRQIECISPSCSPWSTPQLSVSSANVRSTKLNDEQRQSNSRITSLSISSSNSTPSYYKPRTPRIKSETHLHNSEPHDGQNKEFGTLGNSTPNLSYEGRTPPLSVYFRDLEDFSESSAMFSMNELLSEGEFIGKVRKSPGEVNPKQFTRQQHSRTSSSSISKDSTVYLKSDNVEFNQQLGISIGEFLGFSPEKI